MINSLLVRILAAMLLIAGSHLMASETGATLMLENNQIRLKIDVRSGAISSFYIKEIHCEMIGEPALICNFRINLPLKDYQANYIEGMSQIPEKIVKQGNSIVVAFSGMTSEKGSFPVDLIYMVTLHTDYVSFKSRLTNHFNQPVAEFWFPRMGGWTRFGNTRDAMLATPNYNQNSRHDISLFRNYPGNRGLGSEAAEWYQHYPGMVMPWWDLYDAGSGLGLYMGYHDTLFRFSTWHTYLLPDNSGERDAWLTPVQAAGDPVGLVFSHVRYPFILNGESLEAGEFIIRIHPGDWHKGSTFYRNWFLEKFPFDKSDSWLRKESSWFSSIIYQPEDKIIADKFLDLVRDGADGFQMDKVCVAAALDFNPLNKLKPDLALCEGLVQAIDRLYNQCRDIDPNFRMASEFGYDRLLPYFDVGYRNSSRNEISALRYVFPEWTSCNHISAPRDFRGVNGAVLTGAVLCVEPGAYQGSPDQPLYHDLALYIKEINRIRSELTPYIFTGNYYDNIGADIRETGGHDTQSLVYKVHGHKENGRRAIVVVNGNAKIVVYIWDFTHKKVNNALIYKPFHAPEVVRAGQPIRIRGDELNILIEQ